MNVGKLYQVKKYYWFLYPSKDVAAHAASLRDPDFDTAHALAAIAAAATTAVAAAAVAAAARYCSKYFNCNVNVSYISPKSIFVFLEQNEKVIKVLTTNGEVGWIYLAERYKNDIEEMNQ